MLLSHFKRYSNVCYSLKLVNFGLMINCFGPVRSGAGQNIIGSFWGPRVGAIKFTFFSVRSGSGQKIMRHYRVEVPKILPHRTLVGWVCVRV